ncbi:hypothetical protein GQR60_00780 [Labilibaculum sp. A4]|uniref:hypothetical protein n=1 Tax=Labilibaculum euxinus TaxID=2686357 RepID=UPI000F62106F|nr:hypothetical protein [Labilibaculum euxinus]MDQ1769349.1 hypothetical protein [Labilibaculum euxinus]MWN74875.1 hypothetical protein [Labilibaculum euxinus]
MASRKLNKKQLREKQIVENKQFNKTMLISFSLLLLTLILTLVFYTYGCDTKYAYEKFALYRKEVPKELVCMSDNRLQYHESSKIMHKNKAFYICSSRCNQHFINHYREVAFVTDAYSDKIICKSDAIVGLKEKNQPMLVYFENIENFKNFYIAKTSKTNMK